MSGERRQTWEDRHRSADAAGAPSPFVARALDALAATPSGTRGRRALDVACGRGRHALLLAERGYRVDAVDFAVPALTALTRSARARGLTVDCIAADVTEWPLPIGRYALVVVVDFLDRAVFASLRASVAPGGALLYETHRREDGVPPLLRPEFLLAPGDLDELCHGWQVLLRDDRSTVHHGKRSMRAGVLAQRPSSPH